jgi:hypothetical protein
MKINKCSYIILLVELTEKSFKFSVTDAFFKKNHLFEASLF